MELHTAHGVDRRRSRESRALDDFEDVHGICDVAESHGAERSAVDARKVDGADDRRRAEQLSCPSVRRDARCEIHRRPEITALMLVDATTVDPRAYARKERLGVDGLAKRERGRDGTDGIVGYEEQLVTHPLDDAGARPERLLCQRAVPAHDTGGFGSAHRLGQRGVAGEVGEEEDALPFGPGDCDDQVFDSGVPRLRARTGARDASACPRDR